MKILHEYNYKIVLHAKFTIKWEMFDQIGDILGYITKRQRIKYSLKNIYIYISNSIF